MAEAVDGAELLNELTGYLKRYVILIPFAAETLSKSGETRDTQQGEDSGLRHLHQ